MHEFTTASQIWKSVARAAQAGPLGERPRERGGRVRSLTLELGELNLLAPDQITFWIRELAAREGSPDLQVTISVIKGRVRCANCAQESDAVLPEGELDHHVPLELTCPRCGAHDVTITAGRDIKVVRAEIAPEDPL